MPPEDVDVAERLGRVRTQHVTYTDPAVSAAARVAQDDDAARDGDTKRTMNYDQIDTALEGFIRSQRMFFVATAPLSVSGHVNVSPKGLDTLRILGPHSLAYLDHVGSGAETIAHVRENGRLVVMVCAFQGAPRIVRIHGRGEVLEPQDPEFAGLRSLFPPEPGGRAIVRLLVERISDSCGFGVPLYVFEGDRSQLVDWGVRKGEQGLRQYQQTKNKVSIDGLPALRWVGDSDP
jgi:hypothetical protein